MAFGEVGFAALALAAALNLPVLSISIPIVIIASIIIMIISQKKGEHGDIMIALVASRSFSYRSNNYGDDIWIWSKYI